MNPDLELVSELLLDPGRHFWLQSVYGQRQVMFEVDDLRERREPFVEIFGES